ncbi:sugar phosphate permease [Mycolicibacterium phlei]|uniref:MFS transporter n=1 Tax=Mycolicibacterium phlei DSM 43239 = CCUG 21000 TaxID=1226750 RepID=A0A5N5UTX4_MYCPH|nr:MFS transporter [Mycolicibacterium phlei]VEG11032.1 sugar phosphate permease [Mycobacteroides chelonae]AMO62932.1 putative MFS-type transporter YhjX [Mycolicibacterium phlei]KAB7751959.1 MFS transporter [Mycolicibacterium phlei DSM 43239 = CCUG 21000]KXW59584.1 MFS transporter [Mycolicibacterium phlei DSM 43072]KXW60556.1 MFS transporter [Mycolicibacterium phlei DSM 43239 = CCUG 21000]
MTLTDPRTTAPRLHWAWVVAAASFVALLAAAGFRAVPGVMMTPLHDEFGWSHGTVGLAVSVNMTLFGVTAPFAAALMDRFGVRPVLAAALALIAAGSALSTVMTASWQLVVLWGVLVGVGTGSISMGFVATIATRWFEARRGLVTGVLTAASSTGQLIFLPLIAEVTARHGWRWASLIVAAAALAVVPLVVVFLRNYPQDKGLAPYGAGTGAAPAPAPAGGFRAAFDGLLAGLRVPAFWLLAGSFAICGMTANGLIGTHFIPAAHDHGMPATIAAGLLATIGILDVAGTVISGWLTDRFDPRLLLVVYYTGRGLSLALLPALLSPTAEPGTWVFVIFYGLDWVATVPPTIMLCRMYFGAAAPVVFGWVFASHQLGAAVAAAGAGWLRDLQGTYDLAFYLAAGLCLVAAGLCGQIRKPQFSAVGE